MSAALPGLAATGAAARPGCRDSNKGSHVPRSCPEVPKAIMVPTAQIAIAQKYQRQSQFLLPRYRRQSWFRLPGYQRQPCSYCPDTKSNHGSYCPTTKGNHGFLPALMLPHSSKIWQACTQLYHCLLVGRTTLEYARDLHKVGCVLIIRQRYNIVNSPFFCQPLKAFLASTACSIPQMYTLALLLLWLICYNDDCYYHY